MFADYKPQSGFIDQVNQACYDNCASIWDRFPFPNALPGFIEKYYQTSLGKRVLDVGSGTGILAQWLADQGFEVLCLDPSPEMVKRCRAKGLNTLQNSIQSFQPDRQFGMVFAILSLIHVPKNEFAAQLKKITETLEPEGLIFLGMIEGAGEGFSEESQYPRFFAYYTLKELEEQTHKYFVKLDQYYVKANNIGYILVVLKKKSNHK